MTEVTICKPAFGIVKCGACGRDVRRAGEHITVGAPEVPRICSRTLVAGRFLPSCSDECHGVLKARIGTANRVPKRSYAL